MSFGERLKDIRKSKGFTLRQLGDKIGRSESVVQRYESGVISNLDNEVVANLANALGTTPTYLMGWSNVESTESIKIPVLGTISCGNPITAEENIEEYKKRLADNLPSGEFFYLKAEGDSMSPVILDGSYVLCRQQNDVENGEIAAVLVNGETEAALKKVRKIRDSVLLESINRDYEPYVVTKENPGKIVGKAIEVSNKL